MDATDADDIKEIRANLAREMRVDLQSDEERHRSSFLYALLASLLKYRPLSVIKQVKESNGLEAYRLLIQSLEPTSKNRSLGLLTILEWGQFDMKKAYAECEKTGAKLDDTNKFATLTRCVTGQLKTWFQLHIADTQDYTRLREAIIQYDNATIKWSNAMILGQDPNGLAPIEVDQITDAEGNKSKGKSKDGGGG